jgi:hypothetical protein
MVPSLRVLKLEPIKDQDHAQSRFIVLIEEVLEWKGKSAFDARVSTQKHLNRSKRVVDRLSLGSQN